MFGQGERQLAEEILRLDDQLDRLYFFSLRTVKRNIVQKPEHYVDYVITINSSLAGSLRVGRLGDIRGKTHYRGRFVHYGCGLRTYFP
jgi:hypothetical protein